MDEVTISPAGDPFYAAPRHDNHQESPHGCYSGVVYIGHLVHDLWTGEEVEVIERMPCKACQGLPTEVSVMRTELESAGD